MRYGSVCSGIEAATVAWHPLGWQAAWYSEIEPFPCAVLKHHYPAVPNYGDMTKFEEWRNEPIDLLVGGTPCQSFSVAGLRKGLADPRGNLMLTYLAIAQRHRPQWLVWENVPGVLSSGRGRDFGTFLGALGELGYGWAYRVLDAQWFGVAQRRRRVFVIGYLGDWRRAAQVLFERESVRRDTAPSREKGQEVAGTFKARANSGGWCQHVDLAAGGYMRPTTARMASFGEYVDDGTASTIKTRDYKDATDLVAQPITFGAQMSVPQTDVDLVQTLQAKNPMAVAQPIAPTLTATNDPSRSPQSSEVTQQVEAVHSASMQVRRLTPVECERLQGFPDNYTNIPWRKSTESPDGPRYKALGNSMAVPVMAWIGKRIKQVDEL